MQYSCQDSEHVLLLGLVDTQQCQGLASLQEVCFIVDAIYRGTAALVEVVKVVLVG